MTDQVKAGRSHGPEPVCHRGTLVRELGLAGHLLPSMEQEHLGNEERWSLTDSNDTTRGFSTSVPNVARIYDHLLGGKDNFDVDRRAAEELLKAVPDAAVAARQNRDFLRRAVGFLARDCGFRQFIDIGTGLPTRGNVHEIAQQFTPGARVLYVDNDPVVVTHAQALLANNATTVAINRDLREPDQILGHPALRGLIDINAPVAILLVAVLHFVKDSDGPHDTVARLKDAMAPGSYLVISHVTGDDLPAEAMERTRELYENSTAPGFARTYEEIARFFDGLQIVSPGVVNVSSWRANLPVRKPGRAIFYAGVGRKLSDRGAEQ
jgi:S-adenosyl methyltransferase